ncbi:MAG: hypothetical protein GW762_04420 [Candidatus Pacebacteria bacterium]|nr:hypothetical protein [Candidatus Paceibacterota bacterium]PIR63391.1 MAG: hypothetical protein COU64_04930 [Candidatus Pacebacteria bacterium CG10_big_fil_rev_8_21_14_0_10_40_26]PIZ79139.1 MAG: hypothetical protein COY01_01795 [Candidatus Pacebacteria bacterium CG_4_10_14_0_2_um_filter_40_20]PJA68794.1 MAG: hypothetical protein CO156_02400 [Candidatus Pacebacteria bacterium CG_4_9_14_3_um_filter_40_12]PJC42105.1 MAG: hypothetical protein CO041_00505 [Candidatus Pacebacteria bacterium CG_4_9_
MSFNEFYGVMNASEFEQSETIQPQITTEIQRALDAFPECELTPKLISDFADITNIFLNHSNNQEELLHFFELLAQLEQKSITLDTPEQMRLLPEVYLKFYEQLQTEASTPQKIEVSNSAAATFCVLMALSHRGLLQKMSPEQDLNITSQIPIARFNFQVLRPLFAAKRT